MDKPQIPQLNNPAVSCRVVHCKKAPFDVYIGRPSKWGNPFTHLNDSKTLAKFIVSSRDEAVEAYRAWITIGEGKHLMKDLPELKNKVLGCWCHPQSCHGDVLSELVNKHCNSSNALAGQVKEFPPTRPTHKRVGDKEKKE
jgi:hypothetical protein